MYRFVLKTREQRAAEKALMDKSPLKTLTLEDFLESERHKLTGTLTPVTPESFAKWKKDRLDKKAAEDEARKAKEATGRAMFESGDWKGSDSESSEEGESEDEDEAEDEKWNLESMRKETERLRQLREEERLANGEPKTNGESDSAYGSDDDRGVNGDGTKEEEDDGGEGSSGGQ